MPQAAFRLFTAAWRATIKALTAEDAEEFRDSVRNIIEVADENAANDANSANLRESEDRVKRRKDPTNSSRLKTNLIVSNAEGAKDAKVANEVFKTEESSKQRDVTDI